MAVHCLKTLLKTPTHSLLFQNRCLQSFLCIPFKQRFFHSDVHDGVAIVGSGPAGYYTAQHLLKGNSGIVVDIYEKLPVPFGLVRYGVAPDHPEVKNVINTFTQTAQNERCNFLGNVEIGKDVSLQELRSSYSAVILCYGASEDKCLGIQGEDLQNVISARSFVGWYNGLPQDKDLSVNLDCESAVVLGHGNVALDVARILLTPTQVLEKTDICEHALDMLRRSRVKQVHLVGRRGPLQVSFTIKELRELVKLSGTRPIVRPEDVHGLDKIVKDLPRPRRRLTELIHKTGVSTMEKDLKMLSKADREWRLHFCRSPLRINSSDTGHVSSIDLVINKLQGDDMLTQRAVATAQTESIPCGLVLRSIGYKGLSIDSSLPFNKSRNIIEHDNSRVKGKAGLYCTGWIANGPVGVIADTMNTSFDTGRVVLQDLEKGDILSIGLDKRNRLVNRLLNKAVTFKSWEKIDAAETAVGAKVGKPREKIVDVNKMLDITER